MVNKLLELEGTETILFLKDRTISIDKYSKLSHYSVGDTDVLVISTVEQGFNIRKNIIIDNIIGWQTIINYLH